MRRISTLLSLAVFVLAAPLNATDDSKDKNKSKQDERRGSESEWQRTSRSRTVTNRDWDRTGDLAGWARRTEGHRPHDLNGDGLITRNEWPGSDTSFRRLDRNHDGVISKYDRSIEPNTGNIHGTRK